MPYQFYASHHDGGLAGTRGVLTASPRAGLPRKNRCAGLLQRYLFEETAMPKPKNGTPHAQTELESLRQQLRDLQLAFAQSCRTNDDTRERRALRAAHIGTWDWDSRSGCVTCSSEFEQIVGLAPGTFGGTYDAFLACVHPADRETVQTAVAAAWSSDQPFHLEYRVVRPDGSLRRVSARGRAIKDTNGAGCGMAGTVEDVTDSKITRANLDQLLINQQEQLHERTDRF